MSSATAKPGAPVEDRRPLRVCIDARGLARGTGVSSYEAAMRAGLARCGVDAWRLVARPPGLPAALARPLRWLAATSSIPRPLRGDTAAMTLVGRDVFRLAQVHFDVRRRILPLRAPGPPGIMHWAYPVPLRMAGWINVYTIHDAIPLAQPGLTAIDPKRHRRLLRAVAASADALVTVSAAAGREIAAALGLPEDRVLDCGGAVDVAAPFAGERGDHLIVCGQIESRKNIARIVAAHRASGVANPLLIVGPDGADADAVRRAAGAAPGVRWLPYATRPELIALIGGARALLMPSLAEGFGLPVAEAMALGTPVLTSDAGALAETAGGAALLVDPLDVAGMADGIRRLCRDDRLANDLRAARLGRAPAFAPERLGERLLALYRACIASRAAPDYRAG